MANRDTLRQSLLAQLDEQTPQAEQVVDQLLPLIEYWMQDAILLGDTEFKRFKRMLNRKPQDRPALRQLFQQQTVFELDET